jgi:hypothetical protein
MVSVAPKKLPGLAPQQPRLPSDLKSHPTHHYVTKQRGGLIAPHPKLGADGRRHHWGRLRPNTLTTSPGRVRFPNDAIKTTQIKVPNDVMTKFP